MNFLRTCAALATRTRFEFIAQRRIQPHQSQSFTIFANAFTLSDPVTETNTKSKYRRLGLKAKRRTPSEKRADRIDRDPVERAARRLQPLPKQQRWKGVVVSSRQNKTVMVEVGWTVLVPKYNKYITKRRKFPVHDEANIFLFAAQIFYIFFSLIDFQILGP